MAIDSVVLQVRSTSSNININCVLRYECVHYISFTNI